VVGPRISSGLFRNLVQDVSEPPFVLVGKGRCQTRPESDAEEFGGPKGEGMAIYWEWVTAGKPAKGVRPSRGRHAVGCCLP